MGLFNKHKKKEERKPVESRIWVFCAEQNPKRVMEVICYAFGLPKQVEGTSLILNNADMHINVQISSAVISDDAKSFVEGQIRNVWGHFHEVHTENLNTKINLLHQIRMTGSVIEIDYSYDEDPQRDKKSEVWKPFICSLSSLKGILLTEKGTEILGEGGSLILSDRGETEALDFMPYERELSEEFQKAGDPKSRKRRDKSMEFIRSRHIYVPAWLPLCESEEEVRIREEKEVAGRAAALLTVALYSECLLGENMEVKDARAFVQGVLDRFEAEEYLSPREKAYLENPDSTQQERVHHSWQYENLYVMEWALGLIKELPFPDTLCDVPLTVQVLRDFSSMEDFLSHVTYRSSKELLEAADLIYRLDWACVDSRVNGLPAPGGMDGGITMERHKSLNWLIGYGESAPWDEVDTPT